ncbi:efflux RND transporter periplasmic adaptor subunit [Zavarzinella formosa]|uniref:efflux RND transporter periplasmic adaptor subunit n=1 Tax=Zavarzinella formosa TaxID=360055 RepID=UPI0002D771EE|nr:efflux RND transporter periplasmic adaptor subunit [Zavarzinella formosa]
MSVVGNREAIVKLLKRRWWVVLIVIGVAGGLAVASGHLGGNKPDAAPKTATPVKETTVSVTVDKATARPVRRLVSAVGSLYGWDEVAVTPKVEGRVVRVYRDVGDVVKPGEPLLDLDATDFQLAVAEARRALELELAKLGLREQPGPDFDVTQLPSVVRTDSLVKQADLRVKRLQAGGRAVTDEEVQQATTDVEVAKANRQQAVLEAKATIAAARQKQASLESAEQRLRDTRLIVPVPLSLQETGMKTPAEYVISFRKVTEGEMVRIIPLVDAPPMFRLVIDRPLKLQLTLPERHRTEVKLGQTVELEVESYPGEIFSAAVSRINPAIERSSRTFAVEIIVPNADRRLGAGSFAKANIITKEDAKAVTVPEEAIISFAGISRIFIMDGDKVKAVPVKTGTTTVIKEGDRQRTWVEVEGNLKPGAAVVTSGFSRLADGMTANVRTDAGGK